MILSGTLSKTAGADAGAGASAAKHGGARWPGCRFIRPTPSAQELAAKAYAHLAAEPTAMLNPVVFGQGTPGFETGLPHNPAVVLVQEWWGVTEIVKKQALLLAAEGFRVLIPDLYRGKVGVDMEEAHHLMTHLDFHRAVDQIREAVRYLRDTGSPRVGITSGCMGGALAFAAAAEQVTKTKIPVSYHTGMLDPIQGFSDPQTALELEERMRSAGCDIEVHLYPGTAHSFLCAVAPEGAPFLERWGYGMPPKEQMELAWTRIVGFLKKHLPQPA